MDIVIILITLLVLYLIVERKLELRKKYQAVSSNFLLKFNAYFIDFFVFVFIIGALVGLNFALEYFRIFYTEYIKYILYGLSIYSLYIICPGEDCN